MSSIFLKIFETKVPSFEKGRTGGFEAFLNPPFPKGGTTNLPFTKGKKRFRASIHLTNHPQIRYNQDNFLLPVNLS